MTIDERYKEEMIDQYQKTYEELVVYPHYRAWLDAEMAMYESAFGEGQAFMHGFIECYYMLTQYKTLQDEEVIEALKMTMSNKGADLKNAIKKLKELYSSGTFQK